MPHLPQSKKPSYLPKRNGNDRSNPVHKTARWRRASLRHRAASPECEVCLMLYGTGGHGDVLHVDHVIGLAQGGDAYNPRNLMTLCASHHGRKSAMESRGYCPESIESIGGSLPYDRSQVIRDVASGHGQEVDPQGGAVDF